jgi:hypothetical protein
MTARQLAFDVMGVKNNADQFFYFPLARRVAIKMVPVVLRATQPTDS